ncbi:Type I restriction-modification system, S subunit [Microcystis aeruginosa PCC 9809]|jgi:type I restriction enzyme S subunit|uniref:Type I restriction-modification system, S subunit n=2 Tax=Microcystis TaxID=1125 RepID=I4HMQ7_MICAE|nr:MULTISPECIES: restriction endonuclease subunit S [Microcystis]MBD2119275.1 restriction endonuclease subunit S [Microcystis wesenbergii FACHB-1339]MCZ8037096.1 restriction endonuclease subunit S [Microcystis sp. LE17-20A]CCI23331.1 Type I restriction-modification system, S subunit [Microcystis aeruginosa PCC 9809]
MRMVPLGDLMASRVPSLDPSKYPKEVFELWSIPAFDTGQPEITEGANIGSSKKCVEPNDVLLSRIVPHIRRAWVVSKSQNEMRQLASSEWIVFRDESFYPDYLRHALTSDSFHSRFMQTVAGVGGSLLRARPDGVKKIKIPLPPLEEQRRIAAILDKADGVRRKRKEAIRLTEELLRSTFLEMFGDPVTNPKGWEIGKVIDYADCIVPGRDKPKSFTGDIPWVTTTDLNHLGYTYKSRLNIGLTIDEIKQVNARIIPKDSVLLTCAGDLGVTSIAGCNMVVNQQLHSFQCNEIDNHFLMHVITYQKNFMHQRATQTTVPYMNKTACNSIPVIYPPLELQRKFGGFCRKFSASTSQFDSLEQSENLFNSLLQRAFRGEL